MPWRAAAAVRALHARRNALSRALCGAAARPAGGAAGDAPLHWASLLLPRAAGMGSGAAEVQVADAAELAAAFTCVACDV